MSPDGEHLYNTLDADHFFNSHTLARSVTESRLLAAVPGFLTAVGVIGTFFGLQLGLGALELNTGDTEQLKSGISTLISSASIAFMTSVWGVFLSLLFNVIEKFVEGHLRDDIASLQTRIDELYSRITAERTLLGIESHSKVSRDTLNGLAEQIGERMQVAVQNMADTVTTGMEASLSKVMEPAIAQLVSASNELSDKQGKSSEDALKKLLEEFTAQLGKAGTEQGAALNQVSQGINSSINQWGDTMSRFMAQLNMTITRLEEMGKQQQQVITQTIGQSVEEQTRLSRESADQTRQVISDLVSGLRDEREKEIAVNAQRREQNQQDEAQRQQALMDQLASFMEKQNGEVNASVSKTAGMTEKLMSELKSQQDAISTTIGQTFSDQKQLNLENTEQTRQVIEDLMSELRSEREKEQEAGRQRREQNRQDEEQRQETLMAQLSEFLGKQNDELNASVTRTASMTTELMAELKRQQEAIGNTIDQTFADQKHLNQENTEHNRAIVDGLIKGIEHDREQAIRNDKERRELTLKAEETRQASLMNQLGDFLKTQNAGVQEAMDQSSRMNDAMMEQLNRRIEELAEQDKHRNESFLEQTDNQNLAAKTILDEARALNHSVEQMQNGLNKATDSLFKTGSELNLAAGRLQQGYEQVAHSNDALAGNIAMVTNANVQTAKQVDQVTENLHMIMETCEELQEALSTVSEQVRSGAEISTRSARDLVHHHEQYREQMTGTIEHLHEQLSELLEDYGRKVNDQTADRMQEWNKHTREYTNAMSGVVSVMQDMVEDMDSKEAAWQ